MLGSEGVYLYHLSLAEPDNTSQIPFPSATSAADSVQEFSISVDVCCLVLRACVRKALPFNEVAERL